MSKRVLSAAIRLAIAVCLFMPALASAAANEQVGFKLLLEKNDNNIVISIWGYELEDVYAFEISLGYDASRLRLLSSIINVQGFALEPLLDLHTIKLAHTKTGAVAGANGNAKLATLSFERISEGDAVITLRETVLVSSELQKVDLRSGAELIVPANAGSMVLADMKGHWAEAAIRQAVKQGIVSGYPDGLFHPNRDISRAEFATLLARALQLSAAPEAELDYRDEPAFAAWAKPSVAAVTEAGLMKGYENRTFRPESPVTRAEMAVVIARALNLPSIVEGFPPAFADAERIPAWAQQAATAVQQAGIMRGRSGKYFAPQDFATRAEAATLLLTVYNRLLNDANPFE